MILIVTEKEDNSSQWVHKWISYFGQESYQIFSSDTIKIIKFSVENGENNFIFRHNEKEISLDQFSAIWFRRGWFTIMYKQLNSLTQTVIKSEIDAIEKHVKNELKTFQEHIYQSLSLKKNVFGNVNNYNINKLDTLSLAHNVGLKIPDYCITSSKSVLINFQEKRNSKILSKAISENIDYKTNKEAVFHVNNVFSTDDIQALPDHFQATLFQVYYEKHFEIRAFVFDKLVYAMAIFSQQNQKTATDYRNYDNQKITRCLPYNLPVTLQNKVKRLLGSLNLKTGSVDFIYSKENQYVFLEVNPVGQFGIVSRSGNYHLERTIAQTLMS